MAALRTALLLRHATIKPCPMPFELSVDLTTLAILAVVAFIAGFIDAIAGGGGLLTTPALLTAGMPPHLVLGTNKLSSTFGSATASFTFYRRKLFHPRQWVHAIVGTLVGALAGAVVAQVQQEGFQRLTTVDDDPPPEPEGGSGGGRALPVGGERPAVSATRVDLTQDEFYGRAGRAAASSREGR